MGQNPSSFAKTEHGQTLRSDDSQTAVANDSQTNLLRER